VTTPRRDRADSRAKRKAPLGWGLEQVKVGANGASGGGHAAVGGMVGPAFNTTLTGGDGGASYGGPTLVPLVGDSGGAGSPQAKGGGGGGAIQIVAVESITIGGGATLGGINAGGVHEPLRDDRHARRSLIDELSPPTTRMNARPKNAARKPGKTRPRRLRRFDRRFEVLTLVTKRSTYAFVPLRRT